MDSGQPIATEIFVSPEQKQRIEEHLKKHSIKTDVRIENIGP